MKTKSIFTIKTQLRKFCLTIIMVLMGFVVAIGQSDKKPNVVFMVADNVGYGDVGGAFQGGEIRGMPTPRIDKLQSEGLVLTQFITEAGCTPSRAALLTGRYAHRAGLGSIVVVGTPSTLRDEEITMAELFKSVGYNTAITGKWHVGQEEQSRPVNQGFDEYKGSKKVGEGRIDNTIPFLFSADETADVAKDEATQVVNTVFKDEHDSEFTGYVKSVEVKIPEK